MSVPNNLVGKRVGNNRIELVALLGEGSYGAVYRGIIHRAGLRKPRLCAVKVLRTDLDGHLLLCQRRELELHERVSDGDGIVTLHETFKEGNYQFIVMDFCPDGDLWYGISRGRYLGNDALIKDVFTQIIDATEYCHSHSVYHRDIKPENILVHNTNGRHKVLLADFGLATGDQVSTEMRSGSPWYMSPECWGGNWDEPYPTAPNDVWALGVLLLNLACGRHAPWKYAHQHDRFFRDFVKQPNLLRLFVPLSPQAHDILGRIFVPNPAARITLHDLRVAIQSIKHFAVPAQYRSEYHEYQRAVWRVTVGASSSRPLCLKIIPTASESFSHPAACKGDDRKVRNNDPILPIGLPEPARDHSVAIVDTSLHPVIRVDPRTRALPGLPRLSSRASSMDSDGPTTPEMLATIPDVEVPDITDSQHDHVYRCPELITPIKTGPPPIDSWQNILDAIREL